MDRKIAIIRREYVGWAFARLFAAQNPVVGFGSHAERIEKWMTDRDHTLGEKGRIQQTVIGKSVH